MISCQATSVSTEKRLLQIVALEIKVQTVEYVKKQLFGNCQGGASEFMHRWILSATAQNAIAKYYCSMLPLASTACTRTRLSVSASANTMFIEAVMIGSCRALLASYSQLGHIEKKIFKIHPSFDLILISGHTEDIFENSLGVSFINLLKMCLQYTWATHWGFCQRMLYNMSPMHPATYPLGSLRIFDEIGLHWEFAFITLE